MRTKADLIEANELTPEVAEAVFSRIHPLAHREDGEPLYLESAVDRVIEMVRGVAPAVEPLARIADGIEQLIQALVPKRPDFVGTDYIASKIGKSKQWVGRMAANGDIPKNCIADKISGGRIWQFDRESVDAWLDGLREGAR